MLLDRAPSDVELAGAYGHATLGLAQQFGRPSKIALLRVLAGPFLGRHSLIVHRVSASFHRHTIGMFRARRPRDPFRTAPGGRRLLHGDRVQRAATTLPDGPALRRPACRQQAGSHVGDRATRDLEESRGKSMCLRAVAELMEEHGPAAPHGTADHRAAALARQRGLEHFGEFSQLALWSPKHHQSLRPCRCRTTNAAGMPISLAGRSRPPTPDYISTEIRTTCQYICTPVTGRSHRLLPAVRPDL
ncbi:hypothetical protein Ssi02_65470 [Sinosporangium siamense]|uniref:Uncharacterized protein n=1 Tax=Sinosporangium siamense TaxID=1367973 RepID=A0A919VAC5_9ACTN|nr:hypothetical protein Ssi02_65470 [Sinosporangium siamense]